MSIEIPIENRTGDLPYCSIVPQPTAPPRASHLIKGTIIDGVMGFVFKVISFVFPLHMYVCVYVCVCVCVCVYLKG